MAKPSNTLRKPQASPDIRERAERLRDAAGRFIRRSDGAADISSSQTPENLPPAGSVPAPVDAHPEAYALKVDAGGAGLRCPPGSCVIVEPVSPVGAGLVVLYRKGRGPEIWDFTQNFVPGMLQVGEGSTITPFLEVMAPVSGRCEYLDAGLIEKAHRVIGVYMPAEIMQQHRPLPPNLPLWTDCPEGMVQHLADGAAAYPLVRRGETVVVDLAQREPAHGALCLLEWNNGTRSILQTNLRALGGSTSPAWWVDPINRPVNREAMERLFRGGGMLFSSDGPYSFDHLREKIVGTVVGVLVPKRRRQEVPSSTDASLLTAELAQRSDAR